MLPNTHASRHSEYLLFLNCNVVRELLLLCSPIESTMISRKTQMFISDINLRSESMSSNVLSQWQSHKTWIRFSALFSLGECVAPCMNLPRPVLISQLISYLCIILVPDIHLSNISPLEVNVGVMLDPNSCNFKGK